MDRLQKTSMKAVRFVAGWAVSATLLVIAFLAQPALTGGMAGAQTTYAELTSSNASSGSANVSKVAIPSVLPATSQAKVYAHLFTWFGNVAHKDVGYNSSDPVQIEKQVADMISRGISGAVVNWHGPTNYTNQAALGIMAETEKNSSRFAFSIEEDAAAFSQCASTVGCDLQAQIVNDLKYVLANYSKSGTYIRYQGKAVIFMVGMEAYSVNWTAVESALPERPILVLRPANGAAMTTISSLQPVSIQPDIPLSCRLVPPPVANGMEASHA